MLYHSDDYDDGVNDNEGDEDDDYNNDDNDYDDDPPCIATSSENPINKLVHSF